MNEDNKKQAEAPTPSLSTETDMHELGFELPKVIRRAHLAEAPTKHKLKLTPGHVNKSGEVELPWKCEACGKYFKRRTDAETCVGTAEAPKPDLATFHFHDCPCFDDSVEHDEDCKNCTCVAEIEREMGDQMRLTGPDRQWLKAEASRLWAYAIKTRREAYGFYNQLLEARLAAAPSDEQMEKEAVKFAAITPQHEILSNTLLKFYKHMAKVGEE